MKKVPWRFVIISAFVIVAFVALGAVYATGNEVQEKEKAAKTELQKKTKAVQTHPHKEGSAECKEAHKSGKCTGHESGEHHLVEKGHEEKGHEHTEKGHEEKGHEHAEKSHEHKEYCMKKEGIEKLNLTQDQKTKFEALHKKHMEEKEKYQIEMTTLEKALQELMQADKPNKNAIYKKVEEIGALKVKEMKMCVEHEFEVRSLLTPEQLTLFNQMRKSKCEHDHKEGDHHKTEQKHKK